MSRRTLAVSLLGLFIAAAGLSAVMYGMAWLMRPDLSAKPASYSEQEILAAAEARRPKIDPDNPPVLYRYVDYTEGKSGAWYPKGESPILAELVRQGKLPPVAERVGQEPAVVEGVEGIGRYGGIWMRIGGSEYDVFSPVMGGRMSYATLVRWSPQGYPIIPHIAKSFEVSEDYRQFTFALRKGMRWSDGHPFTADDIMYWWEDEVNDDSISGVIPQIMITAGQPGKIEKIDDYHIRITFPKPNGLFIPRLATGEGLPVAGSPAHYLRKYHPKLGDRKLIEQMMRARKLPSDQAAYRILKEVQNPEHPRLWPWVYRTHKASPPYTFVRNPYYFMVDSQGNQLPYVDQLQFDVKNYNMISVSAANGQITLQSRGLGGYTLLMSERKRSGYEVLHWYKGARCPIVISPNLNRRVDPARPETKKKHELLNEKTFRQALSLAINRRTIIDAEFNGKTEPTQAMPGPESYFYDPVSDKAYIQYDPERANRLLDELGLKRRDYEGYRTFRDGSRMLFYVNFSGRAAPGWTQFLMEDWKNVGIRAILRMKSRQLFYTEKITRKHDFTVWGSNGEYLPILDPKSFIPMGGEANYALGFAQWYVHGGLYGNPKANKASCIEPPKDHPLRRALEIYEQVRATGDREKQRLLLREAMRTAAENVWTIGICTSPPVISVVKNGFRNVPRNVVESWDFLSPGNAGIETYYFEDPIEIPGTVHQMQQAILKVTPSPDTPAAMAEAEAAGGGWTGRIIKYLLLGSAALVVLLMAVRHPYIGRRLLLMVPMLAVISMIVFAVIQLPPGDYVTSRIMELEEQGETVNLQQIEELREMFFLDDPLVTQYVRWSGLKWFTTFKVEDTGLLQGNLGRSMLGNNKPVTQIVGDRILLTVLISLGTILFTWAIAVPLGIYSAVRQYSVGDYVLTLIGFFGMCIPGFLLALLLMYFSMRVLGLDVSGLFSSRYAAQPHWDWPKALDLMKHIWVPVVILGIGGTAGMLRVMRGNLLDELKKPYVTTARAKGVRPIKLLMKYPVRLALNPFISGIGGIFPALLSGGGIMAIVLSLPTIGPMMLGALMNEDLYLAGSMLMVFSLLGIFGTLVSDLLLLWVDPRIRFQGGNR